MSFHESCDLIRIEVRGDRTVLLAAAKNGDGDETVPAEIVLDEQIGNGDGWFVRGGENFTETAHEIELEFREDGPWLTAFLTEVDGEDRERQGINLADHIGNDGGRLVWAVSHQSSLFDFDIFILTLYPSACSNWTGGIIL
ncbi:CVNH domain-containing protein [Aspergillus transmontanensis]|uniref:CVNH domain-containing protein n=1 Tax=Aspergillus transmontanensis TaxID=1034304 RepID=A0A5N6WBX0_9EURO|nr:CVNH domain-containing protein [Aspergillus transmontanensis]